MGIQLLVFPTKEEFTAFFPSVNAVVASSTPVPVAPSVEVCVGGLGIVDFSANFSYFLSQKKYESAFLIGICGAYPNSHLKIGDVVRVDTEFVGDLGFQSSEGHLIPWKNPDEAFPTYKGASIRELPLNLASIPSAVGVTVNCCTGTEYLGSRRESLFNAQVESMEGAPFFAICKRFRVLGYEFRGVSNIASNRDECLWDESKALSCLKKVLAFNF